jgi:hypothetical protein
MASLIRRLIARSASLWVLPSASFLVVVTAAAAVPVPDLGDRGHVDGVVDAPVPARAQPVDLAVSRGHLDRRGAVVGGSARVLPAPPASLNVVAPIEVACCRLVGSLRRDGYRFASPDLIWRAFRADLSVLHVGNLLCSPPQDRLIGRSPASLSNA